MLAAAAAGTAFLAACSSSGRAQGGTASSLPAVAGKSNARAPLIVGTTDKVYALDPAGAFDAGSGTITAEIYATLLDHPAGSNLLRTNLACAAPKLAHRR